MSNCAVHVKTEITLLWLLKIVLIDETGFRLKLGLYQLKKWVYCRDFVKDKLNQTYAYCILQVGEHALDAMQRSTERIN